jgi:hypothetical protein
MTESNESASSDQARDVVALGKKCSATAFPNPSRKDCPSRSSLRRMANPKRRLTLDDLPVAHVVRCSPCFQEYTHFRRMSALWRGIQITTASLVVLAAVVFGALQASRTLTSQSDGRSVSANQPVTPQRDTGTKQAPIPIAPLPVRVDLASFSPMRGGRAKDKTGSKIHLPNKVLRVEFVLPLGLEPGEYLVRLEDPAGTAVVDKRAVGRINGGATSVEVDIDLAAASPGSFALLIRPPGLSWRRFPVAVE